MTTTAQPVALDSAKPARTEPRSLRGMVEVMLEDYFRTLDGHATAGLHKLVMDQVEQPLLETVLRHTQGNQTRAAEMLGINRGTLRKKLREHGIE